MKKFIVLFLLITLSFIGCSEEKPSLSIIVPNGIPSIAQSQLEYEKNQYNVDRVNGPQPLTVAFTSESHDIIIAPINLGANLYQKGSPYKLAAVLTWSNLQLLSRHQILDLSELSGQEVISFGQGSIPEMIVSYLFQTIETDVAVEINYQASSVQESLLMFMQGSNYAIVSEPVTSQIYDMDEEIFVYDLSNLWTDITGYNQFPQAGVFVHNNLNENDIESYLDDLDSAAEMAIENPIEIASMCQSMDYPFDQSLIENAMPNSHINFQRSQEVTTAINGMMLLIYEFNSALIGGNLPDEDWLIDVS